MLVARAAMGIMGVFVLCPVGWGFGGWGWVEGGLWAGGGEEERVGQRGWGGEVKGETRGREALAWMGWLGKSGVRAQEEACGGGGVVVAVVSVEKEARSLTTNVWWEVQVSGRGPPPLPPKNKDKEQTPSLVPYPCGKKKQNKSGWVG